MMKPKKKSQGKFFDYSDVIKYIEKKYKINTIDYKGKHKGGADPATLYCNFWHWIISKDEIHNGCYGWLNFDWIEDAETEEWVKEILRLIKKEFSPRSSEIRFWVDW